MKDYLPFGDGFKSFIEASVLPATVAVGLFAFFVYPAVPGGSALGDLGTQSWTQRVVILGVAALAVAEVATLTRPFAKNLLEGHVFPNRPKSWLKSNRERRSEIVDALRQGRSQAKPLAQLGQEMRDYPVEERFVMPTRLGNRMRAAETYGTTRFGLDTPTFYFELRKHAGESIVRDLDRQVLGVDAMVSGFVVAVLFAVSALIVMIWGTAWHLAIAVIGAALVTTLAYYAAWNAAKGYIAAMRALVNEGRLGLATSLGLELPKSLEVEREFWSDVRGYVFWGPGTPEPWDGTAKREATWTSRALDRK